MKVIGLGDPLFKVVKLLMALGGNKRFYVNQRHSKFSSWFTQSPPKNHGIGRIVDTEPTLIGALIQNQHADLIKKKKKISKNYKHRYQRNALTTHRRMKVTKLLRYHFKLSMNNIAEVIGVSTRTINEDIQAHRRYGNKAFHVSRLGFRSKKCMGIITKIGEFLSFRTLKALVKAYINGLLDDLETLLGGDIP